MLLPPDAKRLVPWAEEIIDRCCASMGQRAMQARSQKQWLMTGSPDGNSSILNMLYPHIDRTASYFYSPSDLRMRGEFTQSYPKEILGQAQVAARVVSREWERRDIDMQFGEGVAMALTYGTCIPKLMYTHGGLTCKLCMPWQIGVYREDEAEFSEQEAVDEKNWITPFDLWRRISHLPNAIDLFKRARSHARRKTVNDDGDSYFHQVLIGGMNPSVQTAPPFTQQPGGLVQIATDASGAQMSATVAEEMIAFHELYAWDDEREDFTTIQIAEPDILIAPQFKRRNLFIPEYLPYGKIQPNKQQGYFWGRSEMADLYKLQNLMRNRLEDIKRLMAMQYDRRYFFTGQAFMTDELYDQMKQAGYANLGEGADVKDVTPELPKEAFGEIAEIQKLFNYVAGFDNIMSGQGEPGVRAGNHAEMLLKTASPRMRDRALLVERQCADLCDKSFHCLADKEAKGYWTDEAGMAQEFMLSQLPDDFRLSVDSHSSSPIYEDNHAQLAFALAKIQAIGAEDLIEMLPVPNRDLLKIHLRERQAAQQKLIQEHPELLTHGKTASHHKA